MEGAIVPRIVILGAGGHATALAGVIRECYIQPPLSVEDDSEVHPTDTVYIGVGDIETRKRLYGKFRTQIPDGGVQFMCGAIVDRSATLGVNVLVNTGAQVDHDCNIGDHCVIGPGAILCGNVTLGEGCNIGAGAIIVQGVTLEAGTLIPAGSLVVQPDDIRRPQRVVLAGADTT